MNVATDVYFRMTTDFCVKCLGLAVSCDLLAQNEETQFLTCLQARWSFGADGAMMASEIFAKSCWVRNSIV